MDYQAKKPLFKDVFDRCSDRGYEVVSAKQSAGVGSVPVLHTEMKTPYMYQGEPLMAVSTTDLSAAKGDTLRASRDTELWTVNGLGQRDRNLEDVMAGDDMVQDKTGNVISASDARADAGRFASAASEYPHVMMYEEYVEARTPVNARLHVDPPNEADYDKYLDHVSNQMSSGDVTFVGGITKRSQLTAARQSVPSFQEGMDDFTRSCSGPELGD